MDKKLITVVTPCYNEEANVEALYLAVRGIFAALPQYRYRHLFIDNKSKTARATSSAVWPRPTRTCR
jgi:Glycosyl transferase family 2.